MRYRRGGRSRRFLPLNSSSVPGTNGTSRLSNAGDQEPPALWHDRESEPAGSPVLMGWLWSRCGVRSTRPRGWLGCRSVVALGDQIGHAVQRALIRRVWEFADDAARLLRERLGALLHARDALVAFHHRQNLGERHAIVVQIGRASCRER